ncbi:MAG: hypothetical protein CMC79_01410 [Flavobacteriaceae bacterium]|nr:hypothetical protein [Flavobacteriaceae bacterium]|tara:strand:+ start:2716 stop:5532 length:2817 start_codon:yes stop_codon:yes gene_type:complete
MLSIPIYKYFRNVFLLIFGLFHLKLYSQISATYSINADLKLKDRLIIINQKVKVSNNSSKVLDTLFFNDWSNSYRDTKTPLAQRLAEEFDRSFYFSSPRSKGKTAIRNIKIGNKSINWERLKNQNDIIKIILKDPLTNNDTILLNLDYSIEIPNTQFTGIGYKRNLINLQDFIISLSSYKDDKWLIHSNLNLNDNSQIKSKYTVKWLYPKNLHLLSSMKKLNTVSRENKKEAYFESELIRSPKFMFSKENKVIGYEVDNTTIYTDIFDKSASLGQSKVEKIHRYLASLIGKNKFDETFLITSYDYDLRPLYGLNIFPKIINPYDVVFVEEITFLKTYITEYVRQRLDLNFRQNHWLSEGVTIYLINRYIKENYPNQKWTGKLSSLPYFKKYSIAKLNFNYSFMLYSELMLRNNLHQAATTSKDKLIRFNERIATPYQVGTMFSYLENYIGNNAFDKILYNLDKVKNISDLKELINKYSNKINADNLLEYLNQKHTLDFRINNVSKSNNGYIIDTDQLSKSEIPYQVSMIKNDSIIATNWITNNFRTKTFFNNDSSDYIAINPEFGLPETNKRNNWYSTKSSIFNKPFSIKFIKDVEDPMKTQLLINPTGSYNLYDGVSFAARFHNKTLQSRPFVYVFEPGYSTQENTLVGTLNALYRHYNDSKSNYLTQFKFYGSSFHYSNNLRYTVAVPSLRFYFRSNDLRDNLRNVLSLSWFHIERELMDISSKTPNYSLAQIKFVTSNPGSVKFLTMNNSLEIAKDFKKIILEIQYRKLFSSGRLFSSRLFFGSFLGKRKNLNNYFNFNLNRPNDYLFEYSYLGRSETEGFYSQQFILNEGGFKSIIPNSSSDRWILSTNFAIGIWKWFEVYADMGILNNINLPSKGYYDYGIRLNFIPDYFELYFPFGSSYENEINSRDYLSKVRFVLSLNGEDLGKFFSRKWL